MSNVFNYPTLAECYKVAALNGFNKLRALGDASQYNAALHGHRGTQGGMSVDGILRLQTVEGTGLPLRGPFFFGTRDHVRQRRRRDGRQSGREPARRAGGGEGMDVISILRKKRLEVTAYEVVMSGERAAEPPKRYVSITLTHRVTGHGIPESAVEEAVKLSESKHCSVHFTLDPQMPITSRWEVIEA